MTTTPASAELPSVTFSGTEEGGQSGGILVYVSPNQNHGPVTVNWNSSSTPNTLAASLASGLGTCSSNGNGMVGVASGATVYLSPCQSSVSYTISASVAGCSCTYGNSADFSVAVTTAPATGQLPPVSGAVYDTGSVALVVNGTQISTAPYGAESTPQSIASALASAASGNSLATVAVNGGILTVTAQGDGTITDYSYQVTGSSSVPATFISPSFTGSPSSGSLTGGTNVALYNWAISSYAPNGDVLSMTDSVMGTWSYNYDDFNRLTSGSATAGVDNGLTLGWTYDRYGNRWAQNATGSGNASAVQPQLSFSGNNNHVDGWSYDAAGNLLNDGRNSYQYDAEGRIIKLNGALTYLYDAEGRRAAKYSGGTISASYLFDLGGNQVTELNASGTWMHSNVWAAGGRLLATYEGPGEPHPNTYHFHLTDWLGTQRMQTTAAGNNEEACYSYPFGDGLNCTGSDATEHHFTSKERDAESGLDYFYARYYSSDLARFMTPDWAAAPIAVPYATFGDPQTLNLYDYVQNNPNTGIDMDGHYSNSEAVGGVIDSATGFDASDPFGNMGSANPGGANSSTGTAGSAPKAEKPKAQQQNAGASPSSGGTSTTVTLNIGGQKVTVAYSYGKIFSNYGGGVDITATPQNCSGCAWAQVYSRGSGAKKDGDGIGPLYGDEGRGLSVFYDTPASSSPGRFTATTILGTTDISGKSFTAIGGFTYGYSINANGGVTMMAPSVATRNQMSGAIQVLQNNSPDWTIH
jgi:RHS repeat-associated protein